MHCCRWLLRDKNQFALVSTLDSAGTVNPTSMSHTVPESAQSWGWKLVQCLPLNFMPKYCQHFNDSSCVAATLLVHLLLTADGGKSQLFASFCVSKWMKMHHNIAAWRNNSLSFLLLSSNVENDWPREQFACNDDEGGRCPVLSSCQFESVRRLPGGLKWFWVNVSILKNVQTFKDERCVL